MTDAIPITIVVLSPDGTSLYANRSVLEYSGITLQEVMTGDLGRRVIHPDDVARLGEERREGLVRGPPFGLEQRARRKDGEYRWFLFRYHPLRDTQGRIIRRYAPAIGIDDRQPAQEGGRHENRALR